MLYSELVAISKRSDHSSLSQIMLRVFARFQSTQAYKATVAQLKTDLKSAMKSKDTVKKDTVKGLLSSIKNKEIDTKPNQHTEFLLHELFTKAISQRRDSIKEFQDKRPELAEKEEQEVKLIEAYLDQLPVASSEEVEAKVRALLADLLKDGPLKLNEIFKLVPWDEVKEWNTSEKTVRATIARFSK